MLIVPLATVVGAPKLELAACTVPSPALVATLLSDVTLVTPLPEFWIVVAPV